MYVDKVLNYKQATPPGGWDAVWDFIYCGGTYVCSRASELRK